MKKPKLLWVTDQWDNLQRDLKTSLQGQGCEIVASGAKHGLKFVPGCGPDLVIFWVAAGDPRPIIDMAGEIRKCDNRLPIILVVGRSSEELAIAALKAGISDYFKLPCAGAELLAGIRRCLPFPENSQPSTETAAAPDLGLTGGNKLVGQSSKIRQLKDYIKKVAVSDCAALITGETGTGKELAAGLIHRNSRRKEKPFICFNCAAVPDTLLESELFGYERGAFTGAYQRRDGMLRLAEGGTVFFDEIGDMTPYAQTKILRAIETGEIYPLGSTRKIPLNIRIIAATNQDLEGLMAAKQFRQDLYFRLNVARIHLAPSRERQEDLPVLLQNFLTELNAKYAAHVTGFSEDCLDTFLKYDFPGNIRELKNLLESVFVTQPSRVITFQDLPELFRRRLQESADLPKDERARVLSALFTTNWNKSRAAHDLNWSRKTLYRKMAKYNITKSRTDLT